MNTRDAISAINAFKDALNGSVVDATEVIRRTNICLGCPKRQLTRGMKSNLSAMLGGIANRRRVPPEVANYSCKICGCSMMLLIPATPKDLHVDSVEEAKLRPAGCWIRGALEGV